MSVAGGFIGQYIAGIRQVRRYAHTNGYRRQRRKRGYAKWPSCRNWRPLMEREHVRRTRAAR